jgi:hypothetical protein
MFEYIGVLITSQTSDEKTIAIYGKSDHDRAQFQIQLKSSGVQYLLIHFKIPKHTIMLLSIKNIMSQSYELVGYKYYNMPSL